MSDTEIVRIISLDGKNIEVHIHLSEEEIRRLLLPLVVAAFADEVRRQARQPRNTLSNATEYKS